MVGSVDFGTPLVDDPIQWGEISVANALSDVFAVGGEPVFAMAVLGWPEQLEPELARTAIEAARAFLAREGVTLGGGHSAVSAEPFLGFAVVGSAATRPMSVAGFAPGDRLLLTKPVGTGVLLSATKFGVSIPEEWLLAAVTSMRTLSASASRVAQELGVKGCTDVSGYGLLGSCWEIASASDVHVTVMREDVPLLPGAQRLLEDGVVPTRAEETREWLDSIKALTEPRHLTTEMLLSAPETSGGLLLGVALPQMPQVESAFREQRVDVHAIGVVTAGERGITIA